MIIDPNAWYVVDGGYVQGSSTPGSGIGLRASQLSIASSILTMKIDYGPFQFSGTPWGKPPAQKLLAGGTIMWKVMQLLYGSVEVRAKIPNVTVHPTIWLLGSQNQNTFYQQIDDGASIQTREIDIAEICPVSDGTSTIRQNLFPDNYGTVGNQQFTTNIGNDSSQNFHTYKVVWTPTSVTWFVDGVQTNQTNNSTPIPSLQMFLIIDIEADDGCSGPTGPSGDFPQFFQIDYVKAWDQNNNLVFFDDFTGAPAFQDTKATNLTFIQANSAKGGSSPITVAFPINTQGRSYLTAAVFTNGAAPSILDTLGNVWIPIGPNFGGFQTFHVPSNALNGGANTATVSSAGASFMTVGIAEHCGQLLSSPLDTISFPTFSGSGTTTSTNPTASNWTNEDFLVWGVQFNSTPEVPTPGPGFVTEYSLNDTNRFYLEDTLPNSPTVNTSPVGTFSYSGSTSSFAVGLTVRSMASFLQPSGAHAADAFVFLNSTSASHAADSFIFSSSAGQSDKSHTADASIYNPALQAGKILKTQRFAKLSKKLVF